jgi:hypothetical protein
LAAALAASAPNPLSKVGWLRTAATSTGIHSPVWCRVLLCPGTDEVRSKSPGVRDRAACGCRAASGWRRSDCSRRVSRAREPIATTPAGPARKRHRSEEPADATHSGSRSPRAGGFTTCGCLVIGRCPAQPVTCRRTALRTCGSHSAAFLATVGTSQRRSDQLPSHPPGGRKNDG